LLLIGSRLEAEKLKEEKEKKKKKERKGLTLAACGPNCSTVVDLQVYGFFAWGLD